VSATGIKAETLKILTEPGGPCDIYVEGVKDPEMLLQIIKQGIDIFVGQNPHLSARSPEELAEAFLHHMAERKRRHAKK
jgi:queuine/archaeosine tRNA-ribosyltransferase